MNTTNTETEVRPVSSFDRVSIRGNMCNATLIITQGEQEALTIQASPQYLARLRSEVKDGQLNIRLLGNWLQELEDALSSRLNRPAIVFQLDVQQLSYLDVQCAYIVQCNRLETPHLQVSLNGVGNFNLDWLSAETLEVRHSGSGMIKISGEVEQQKLVLNGVGSYNASALDSQRASVRISGAGLARIRVSQVLDLWLRGVGTLEYSGNPSVRTQISGPGQVLHLVNARDQAT